MLLENGYSATLMNNIILTEGAISITDGEVTLNLNGYDITSTGVVQSTNILGDTLYVCDVFVVSGYNTTFTITGSGTVSANPSEEALEGVNEDDLSVCVLSALNGAYVKIDGGGVYHSTGCTVIYARTESRVDIFDGGFIADEDWYGTYYTLDVWEGEHSDLSSARINVYGGTFVNFNPANHSNDGGYTSKVVELYAHVVEIEDDEYGKVYLVEAHNISDNAEWTQPMCSVCGICFSYRFHFVDGDIIYLLDDCPGCSDIGNGLIFILEAVAGEDEVFYIRDSYSDLYLVFDENNELTLSKEKTENSKFRVYADITVDDKYVLYFVGVGFEFEATMEDDFAFISYCENHNVILKEIGATCTTRGGTAYACEHCGLSDIFDYLPATGHDFEAVVTGPRCCGGEGYTTHTCKSEGCGYSYIDDESRVPALECELSWKDNGDGTCTERCYLPCTKQLCNGEVINGPLAHNDDNIDYACDRCSAHVHKYTTSVVKATCEEGGYTLHTCDGCNHSYKTDEIIALDHDFSEPVSNCDGTHTSTCLRDGCGKTATVAHSISQDDSIYCVCGMIMVEKAYSVEIGDVIVLVHMDGDTLKTMDIDFTASSTSALYLRVSDSAHQESYLLMTESGECLMRKSETSGRLSLESKITDEYRANWIISIAEDGAVSMRTVYNGFLGVDEYGIFCFNYPSDDGGSNGLVYYIYKLKSEDSFGHTWGKCVPNEDRVTHTRTCSTCGIQETNEHNYVVIGGIDATCESAGRLVYACECNTTFIEEDDEHPALGHAWSDWSRGDATNAQHSRECSICSKTETEVCSIDKTQRLGYIVSDGVNGKLIAAQYYCTKCGELANDVCDSEIIPVANEAELRAAISACRSVIFEANIEVTSTINVDCDLVGNMSFDLAGHKLGAYNCALFYIYDSTGQGMGMSVTITGEGEIYTRADDMNTCCPIAFVSNQVELKIMSGTFVNRANSELFILREQGNMSVYGGTFKVAYDGYTGAEEAHCANHNGVIDFIDESGVEFEGDAMFYCAEIIGWDCGLSVDSSTNLRISNGSHIVGGHDEYSIEYCQYDAVVTEPGCCEANGYTTYTCKVCGDSYIDDYTDPIECVWSWKDNGNGTCTYACYLRCHRENGCNAPIDGPFDHEDINNDYVCDNCGAHIHKYESIITPPNCFEEGYTTYTCLCGDSYVADIVDAYGGHEFDIVIVAPTCTEMGYTHHSCSYCGEEFKTDEVPALGHDWIWTSLDENACSAVCSIDNSHTTSGEHVDGDPEDGKCDNCGATIKVVSETVTVIKTVKDLAGQNGWINGEKYSRFEIDSVISVSSSISGNNGKYYTSGNEYRLYQTDKGTITFSAEPGYQIISIKITYAVSNSGCLTFDGANISTGTVVEVNAESITFAVGNKGTATNGQAKITAVEVVYLAVNPCDHNYVDEVTDPTCTDKGYTTYTCSYCGKSYVDNEINALGHDWDWTYVDENTCSAVCLNDDSHTTSGAHVDSDPEDGNCDNCGESVTVTEPEKQEVTLKLEFSNTANRKSWSTAQQVWEQNGVTLTNNKGDSTSNIADYSNPARFYKSSEITIDCKGMKEIVFDCNSSAYAKSLATSLSDAGHTATVSSDKVTLTLTEEKDSITFKLTDGQVRMDLLTVTAMQQRNLTSSLGVNLYPRAHARG